MSDVRLVPLGAAHLVALEALVTDSEVLRFTRIPDPPPPGFVAGWLETYEEGRRLGTREAFAIVDGGEAFLGVAAAPTIDRPGATAELGYVVAPAARGRGVATQALRLLTAWAFAERLERLELLISIDNEASKHVAARCGYVFEGVLRSRYFKAGLREDTELWSRLPGD